MKYFYSRLFAIFVSLLLLSAAGFAAPAVNDLLSAGRISEAVSSLASHDDAESLNLLSRAYFAMEDWDAAVKYGERAVNLDPNNASYHLWLGREYGRKAEKSKAFSAAGNAKKARNEFERAVQLDPSDVAARLDLAQYYTEAPGFMGGGVDKARDQATEIAKYDPGNAHLILARIAVKQKQYADAETQFRAAIQQAKNPADMWLQLADFDRQQGHLDEMQSAVRSAMAQPHKRAESYFDAARELYLGGRNYPNAVEYLQKYLASGELVESAPAFRAHYLIGQLNEKMGQNTAAAAEYQSAVSLASGFVPAKLALGRMQ
jgi:tetratricopeptide (TPR) repeat protein